MGDGVPCYGALEIVGLLLLLLLLLLVCDGTGNDKHCSMVIITSHEQVMFCLSCLFFLVCLSVELFKILRIKCL